MNKKIIQYMIIATAIILLIYGGYSIMNYGYRDSQIAVTDSIFVPYPSTSEYNVVGDKVEFRNQAYNFYDMDIIRVNSTDVKLTNLLNHFAKVSQGTIDYKNESCYLLTMEFNDGSGFKYHSMIIPFNSFDKDNLTFTKPTTVYLFEANNREYVVDTAFNSRVIL